MGMFDSIKCLYPLPLTEELSNLDVNWTECIFQTKDLDCSLTCYFINEDGTLVEEVVEREYILYTEDERKSLKPKPWLTYKDVIEKNRYLKPINHHGIINFYDIIKYNNTQEILVEFNAYFIYGKLDKLELTKTELLASNEFFFEELQEKMAKDPWIKTKNILRYVGWHWFWRKMSNICYVLHQLFSKMQMTIIRTML